MKNIVISSILLACISVGANDSFEIPLDNVKVVNANNVSGIKTTISPVNNENSLVNLEEEANKVKLKESNSSVNYNQKVNFKDLETADSDFGTTDITTDIGSLVGDDPELIKKKTKIELKSYPKVKYVKGYDWFSIKKPSLESYSFYLSRIGINKDIAKLNLGDNTPIGIYVSALYYDLVKGKPSIAENYYLKFDDKLFKKLRFQAREALSDYLIRTGRASKVKGILSTGLCFSYSSWAKNECFYYYGMSNFLTTGNKKNAGLRFSMNKFKKAKRLYLSK